MPKDKELALREFEEIRKEGKFNMLNRRGVMNYANETGRYNLVVYCGNNRDKYAELLKSYSRSE